MDDKLDKLGKMYDDIQIPEQLDQVIDEALHRGQKSEVIYMENKRKSNKSNMGSWVKGAGATAAALVLALGISVNASSDLAENIYKIPVIGQIGRVMTFREYKIDNDTSVADITVPKVENVKNEDIEKKINDMINTKVDAMIAEQAKLDAEYKEAYLETGGTEEDYHKVETIIDYKKNFASDKVLSFEISKGQTLAAAYDEVIYYNLDIETGKNFTLKDLLQDEYSQVKDRVIKEMERLMASNEDEEKAMKESLAYSKKALEESKDEAEINHLKKSIEDMEKIITEGNYHQRVYDIDYVKEMTIENDRPFYINSNGDVVIVFEKYEVAPGSAGAQYYVVGHINK